MLVLRTKDGEMGALKIAFATLALVLMLSAEPIHAGKISNRSKSRSNIQKSQRSAKPSSTPKVQRPLNVNTTLTRIANSMCSARFGTKPNTSRPSGRSYIARPSSLVPRDSSDDGRRTSANTLHVGSLFSRKKPSFPARLKQPSTSKRGGNSISKKEPSVPTLDKQNRVSWINRIHPAPPRSGIQSDKTSRLGNLVNDKKPRVPATGKLARPAPWGGAHSNKQKTSTTKKMEDNSSRYRRRPRAIVKKAEKEDRTQLKSQKRWSKILDNKGSEASQTRHDAFGGGSTNPRPKKPLQEKQATAIKNKVVKDSEGKSKIRIHRRERKESPQVTYHDRPHSVRHAHRHVHIYRDDHDRICHKIVWPKYHFVVRYNCGLHFTFRYVYPYYHRKYVFVSIGGYWPIEYRYVRYYWYGCHPYSWCGYHPVPCEVEGDTYNYYTYNYYGSEGDTISQYETNQTTTEDHMEPAPATLADSYFEDAVKAFESGDYSTAIENFAAAIELAPDDMILPFAYAQALFAGEQYSQAAKVLRTALVEISGEEEGVFYPRGLYPNDDVLFEQIEHLIEKTELDRFDTDLQLLLGYQLLGIGETEEAVQPLQQASLNSENAAAAKILLELLEKIRADNATEVS